MKVIDYLRAVKKIPSWDRTPAISDEILEDLINQIDMTHEDEHCEPYPILGTRPQQYIPRGLLMIHEGQAWKNHGQSLSQLAQRGGLSWVEALAIIEGKNWCDAEHDENAAEITVKKMIPSPISWSARRGRVLPLNGSWSIFRRKRQSNILRSGA